MKYAHEGFLSFKTAKRSDTMPTPYGKKKLTKRTKKSKPAAKPDKSEHPRDMKKGFPC